MPLTHFWRVSWTLVPFVCQHAPLAPPRRVFIADIHTSIYMSESPDISTFRYHFRSGNDLLLRWISLEQQEIPFRLPLIKPGWIAALQDWVWTVLIQTCGRCHVLLMHGLEENVQTDGSWHGVQRRLGPVCSEQVLTCVWWVYLKKTPGWDARGAPRGGE